MSDFFHIGPDGLLHFTDVHSDPKTSEFCIEAHCMEDDNNDYNSGYNYEEYSGNYSEDVDTCKRSFKETSIEIFYCAKEVKWIKKCCERGMNINLKGESCTDHLAIKDKSFQTSIVPHWSEVMGEENILDPGHIYGMKKNFLSVTNQDFKLIPSENEILLNYGGRNFSDVSNQYIISSNL